MSGAAFEGLPRTEPGSGSYIAGSHSYETRLLDAIAGPYLEDRDMGWSDAWSRMQSILKTLPLKPEEGFDPDIVLNGLVGMVAMKGEEGHLEGIGMALDEVVQHFYNLGINDFHVDLSCLPVLPQDVGSGLKGTKRRPLKLTCTSDDLYGFGFNSSYCRFTYIGNLIYGGGSGLEHSELTLKGPITEGVVGFRSRSTIFRVGKLEYIAAEDSCENRVDCDFYVIEDVSDSQIASFLKTHWQLFVEKNRLYVPAGGGKWKKIVPEWKLVWQEVTP